MIHRVFRKAKQVASTIGHAADAIHYCKGRQFVNCAKSIYHTIDSGADVIGSFKKGGKVKRTGKYRLHKGEYVLTTGAAKRYLSRKKKR